VQRAANHIGMFMQIERIKFVEGFELGWHKTKIGILPQTLKGALNRMCIVTARLCEAVLPKMGQGNQRISKTASQSLAVTFGCLFKV